MALLGLIVSAVGGFPRLKKPGVFMLLRIVAIAAMSALAVPTLAVAQGNNEHHPGGGKPPPGRPPGGGAKPALKPGGPPPGAPRASVHPGPHPGPGGARPGFAGPHPGGPPGHQFSWHGRAFHRVHLAPFIYPSGWGYRRWAVGAVLPPLFLAPAYYYADWATLGLDPPQPGFQWVRYGPDLLLVNVTTGEVVDTIYDAFE
jgi:Nickel/cobalt transporter regulator